MGGVCSCRKLSPQDPVCSTDPRNTPQTAARANTAAMMRMIQSRLCILIPSLCS